LIYLKIFKKAPWAIGLRCFLKWKIFKPAVSVVAEFFVEELTERKNFDKMNLWGIKLMLRLEEHK